MSTNLNNMTDEEKYLLLELSYLNIPLKYDKKDYSINTVLNKIINENKLEHDVLYDDAVRILEKLKKYPHLGELTLVAYRNNNAHDPHSNTTAEPKTGFVGYVLENKVGNRFFLFRGTEPSTMDKFTQDMTDNVRSTLFGDSPQVREAKAFFDKHKVIGKDNFFLVIQKEAILYQKYMWLT
ncbi:MAG: hypothetical protein M0Z31_00590 [Clostridia bacterium]|nr:hypothetical protein [Clostridia bacterium]